MTRPVRMNQMKEELNALNKKLAELNAEELKEVIGAVTEGLNGGYFRCTNPGCRRHNIHFSVGVDFCPDCGRKFEWVDIK